MRINTLFVRHEILANKIRLNSCSMRYVICLLVLSAANAVFAAPTIIEQPTPIVSGTGLLTEDIGIQTLGGVFTPLLKRNCKTPCSTTQIFSTADDGQLEIKLIVFRGKAGMTKDTKQLGSYVVIGIPPMRRGEPQVAVTFTVEGNQIAVSAVDKQSNRALKIKRTKF